MQGKRTWAEIDLDALNYNVSEIKKHIKTGEFMAVVKADAYGHGAAVVAPYLEKLGINYFAVSNIEEAEELRRAGVVGEILILGYTDVDLAIELFEQNIIQSVFSLSYAKALNAAAKKVGVKISVHLKIDSGMGRIGFNCRNEESIDSSSDEMAEVAKLSNLVVKGAFTHFSVADSEEPENKQYTKMQYNNFLKGAESFKVKTGKNIILHCCNSAGTVLNTDMQLSLNRIGIIMYGLTPDVSLNLPLNLKPVMSFHTVISQIKHISKGDFISYGRTFKAEKDMVLATVPVGYADGFRRELSNKGYVLINGKKANIVGRICMDQAMVDITGIKADEGDNVTIFGKDLPVEQIADWCHTINYEIVCGISRRVPRLYLKHGKIVRIENYIIG